MSNTIASGEVADEADLEIGAEAIAQNIFKGKVTGRQVYRMVGQGWPIFRLQNKLAARPSAMRAEMARREAEAIQRRGGRQLELLLRAE
jgi:hypothetical protein